MKWPAKIVITIETTKKTEDAPENNAQSIAPFVKPVLPSPIPDSGARWPHHGNHGYC